MYTHPPDASVLGLMQSDVYHASPNQTEAVRILKEHANAIDTGISFRLYIGRGGGI